MFKPHTAWEAAAHVLNTPKIKPRKKNYTTTNYKWNNFKVEDDKE